MKIQYLPILFLITLSISLNFRAQAQVCVIDSMVPSVPGIYPDSFPSAEGCVPYVLDVTFFLPRDTTVNIAGTNITVPFNHFIINNISNLPAGLSWDCNNNMSSPPCFYDVSPGNPNPDTLGCVRISGTPLIPGTYVLNVSVTANVDLIGDQTVIFPAQIIVTPCNVVGTCYSLSFDSNCEPAMLTINNEIPSNGNPGITYSWNFGNGSSSIDENPFPQSYNAGTYIFEANTTIDTIGYVLNSVIIEAYNCNDGIGGGGELYWILKDPLGNELVNTESSPTSAGPATPLNTGVGGIILDPGLWEFQVWDDDTNDLIPSADDGCADNANNGDASVFFSIPPSMPGSFTVTNQGLSVTFSISHPVTVIQCIDTFTIDPKPVKPNIIAAGSTDICEGEVVVLVATSIDSLQWFLDGDPLGASGPTYPAGQAGEYTVVAFSNANCTNESSPIEVNVLTVPTPTILANNNMLSTTATGFQYQWYKDSVAIPGANMQTYTANGSGDYYVQITNTATGCSAFSPTLPLVWVGINEDLEALSDLHIYPNPTNGILFVDLYLQESRDLDIQISDLMGKAVFRSQKSRVSGRYEQKIDLGSLAPGMYLVKLGIGKASLLEKIVVH